MRPLRSSGLWLCRLTSGTAFLFWTRWRTHHWQMQSKPGPDDCLRKLRQKVNSLRPFHQVIMKINSIPLLVAAFLIIPGCGVFETGSHENTRKDDQTQAVAGDGGKSPMIDSKKEPERIGDIHLSHEQSVMLRVPDAYSGGQTGHIKFRHSGETVTFIDKDEFGTLYLFKGAGKDFREIGPDSACPEERELFDNTLKYVKEFHKAGQEQFE